MKYKLVLIVSVLIAFNSLNAQIPQTAFDISPLLIGESMPDATLKATDASEHSVLEILSKKQTVVLFYRGGWCPYCNAHLAEIQEAESDILALGYQIVAISPDSPEKLLISDDEKQLNYELYSDGDGTFSKAVGIAFQSSERQSSRLLEYSAGLNKGYLPVPSVFICDNDGTILFEYISPNYKERMSAKLLISVLKNLK
jgi:peroxiredoxin